MIESALINSKGETIVTLVRHGETDWNSAGRLQGCEDTELNDVGRQQAHQLAQYLKIDHWDVIISSPLKRALETARIIAEQIAVKEVLMSDGLMERDYGEASGLLPEERRSRFPDGVIPGQEEFEHLRMRAMEELAKITNEHEGKRIIVISHGAFINSILYTISEGEFGSFKNALKERMHQPACIQQ